MAQLNPTCALTSPMLSSSFVVQRRAQTVAVNGRAQIALTGCFTGYGVVVVMSPASLERLPDQQHARKTIHVATKSRLQGPSPGFQPDVIVWHGDSFLVTSLEDGTNLGPGWTVAVAESTDSIEAPPQAALA